VICIKIEILNLSSHDIIIDEFKASSEENTKIKCIPILFQLKYVGGIN
jgi:hypothetical protein